MKIKRLLPMLIVGGMLPVLVVSAQGDDQTDTDSDGVPDAYDACPAEAGLFENYGCAEGVIPPDTDADTVLDLFDRCPEIAGANGLDCPDRDGDGYSDLDDVCPDEAGTPELWGCLPVHEVQLPEARAVLAADNIAQAVPFGQLVTNVSQIAITETGMLVVQSYAYGPMGMHLFELNTSLVTQTGLLESQGGIMGVSTNGVLVVDTLFNPETGIPAIMVWDPLTASGDYIELPDDQMIVQVAVNADGTRFVTVNGTDFYGEPLDEYTLRIWDAATREPLAEYSQTEPISQVAFSPDGSRLAVGGEHATVILDTATQQPLATLDAAPMYFGSALAFSPDGSRLAVGQWDGSLSVWDMTAFSEVYTAQLLTSTPWDAVMGVAWSPDGSLIAAGGGPFVDGPPPEGMNNQVVLVNAADGARLAAMEQLHSAPRYLAFSPDGTLLVFASGPTVQFWGVPGE